MADLTSQSLASGAVAHKWTSKARTGDVIINEHATFSSLVQSELLLRGLTEAGFVRPSPIQLKAIPIGRCGFDLIVQAKSGTGKTCVFGVIALESIDVESPSTQVVMLAPTREIAVQSWEVITSIGRCMPALRCYTFIGGLPVADDVQKLKRCHIAIATPGRFKQLIEQSLFVTDNVRMFVLDEADKLMEQGFQDVVNWIYSSLPVNKQMLALSATYPKSLANHLMTYMRDPTCVQLNTDSLALIGMREYYVLVPFQPLSHKLFELKSNAVLSLLSTIQFNQCLVFSNYQMRAQSLCELLKSHGFPSTYIGASQDQQHRLTALAKLKQFRCRVLVSTDLTARGIDAENVNLVINVDVPSNHETYLHRIGRAGRFGSYGAAVSIVSEGEEHGNLRKIEALANTVILPLPDPCPADLALSVTTDNLPSDIESSVTTELIRTTGHDLSTSDVPFDARQTHTDVVINDRQIVGVDNDTRPTLDEAMFNHKMSINVTNDTHLTLDIMITNSDHAVDGYQRNHINESKSSVITATDTESKAFNTGLMKPKSTCQNQPTEPATSVDQCADNHVHVIQSNGHHIHFEEQTGIVIANSETSLVRVIDSGHACRSKQTLESAAGADGSIDLNESSNHHISAADQTDITITRSGDILTSDNGEFVRSTAVVNSQCNEGGNEAMRLSSVPRQYFENNVNAELNSGCINLAHNGNSPVYSVHGHSTSTGNGGFFSERLPSTNNFQVTPVKIDHISDRVLSACGKELTSTSTKIVQLFPDWSPCTNNVSTVHVKNDCYSECLKAAIDNKSAPMIGECVSDCFSQNIISPKNSSPTCDSAAEIGALTVVADDASASLLDLDDGIELAKLLPSDDGSLELLQLFDFHRCVIRTNSPGPGRSFVDLLADYNSYVSCESNNCGFAGVKSTAHAGFISQKVSDLSELDQPQISRSYTNLANSHNTAEKNCSPPSTSTPPPYETVKESCGPGSIVNELLCGASSGELIPTSTNCMNVKRLLSYLKAEYAHSYPNCASLLSTGEVRIIRSSDGDRSTEGVIDQLRKAVCLSSTTTMEKNKNKITKNSSKNGSATGTVRANGFEKSHILTSASNGGGDSLRGRVQGGRTRGRGRKRMVGTAMPGDMHAAGDAGYSAVDDVGHFKLSDCVRYCTYSGGDNLDNAAGISAKNSNDDLVNSGIIEKPAQFSNELQATLSSFDSSQFRDSDTTCKPNEPNGAFISSGTEGGFAHDFSHNGNKDKNSDPTCHGDVIPNCHRDGKLVKYSREELLALRENYAERGGTVSEKDRKAIEAFGLDRESVDSTSILPPQRDRFTYKQSKSRCGFHGNCMTGRDTEIKILGYVNRDMEKKTLEEFANCNVENSISEQTVLCDTDKDVTERASCEGSLLTTRQNFSSDKICCDPVSHDLVESGVLARTKQDVPIKERLNCCSAKIESHTITDIDPQHKDNQPNSIDIVTLSSNLGDPEPFANHTNQTFDIGDEVVSRTLNEAQVIDGARSKSFDQFSSSSSYRQFDVISGDSKKVAKTFDDEDDDDQNAGREYMTKLAAYSGNQGHQVRVLQTKGQDLHVEAQHTKTQLIDAQLGHHTKEGHHINTQRKGAKHNESHHTKPRPTEAQYIRSSNTKIQCTEAQHHEGHHTGAITSRRSEIEHTPSGKTEVQRVRSQQTAVERSKTNKSACSREHFKNMKEELSETTSYHIKKERGCSLSSVDKDRQTDIEGTCQMKTSCVEEHCEDMEEDSSDTEEEEEEDSEEEEEGESEEVTEDEETEEREVRRKPGTNPAHGNRHLTSYTKRQIGHSRQYKKSQALQTHSPCRKDAKPEKKINNPHSRHDLTREIYLQRGSWAENRGRRSSHESKPEGCNSSFHQNCSGYYANQQYPSPNWCSGNQGVDSWTTAYMNQCAAGYAACAAYARFYVGEYKRAGEQCRMYEIYREQMDYIRYMVRFYSNSSR